MQDVEHRLELAVEHPVEVVRGVADAVVGDPVFLEVVRADALAAVDGAHLRRTAGPGRGSSRLAGRRQQPGTQDAQRRLLVLQLALLVLAGDDGAGRKVGDAHRGVGGVDALAARAGGAEDVDTQIVRVDLDVDVFGLGQDEHAGGAGVQPALRLGDGDALHAVHASLVLQPAEDARAGSLGPQRETDVLVAAEVAFGRVENLRRPPGPLGETQIHAQQIAGEEGRLLAALTGLDLQDRVFGVVRVARQQQLLKPLGELVLALLERLGLLGEAGVVGRELLGRAPDRRGWQRGRGRPRRSGSARRNGARALRARA